MKTKLIIALLFMSCMSFAQGIDLDGPIKVSNSADPPADGFIRFFAGDFQGYAGGAWYSLTGGAATASPWSNSTNGIEYHNVEIDDSNTSGRINFTSSSHVYQLSPEGATFTMRDDLTYKFGYYGPDEFGPTANNTLTLGSSPYRWMEIWSVNALNTSSDRRLKKNIAPIEYGLDEVMQLNPVSYKWIEGHDRTMLGLIAQEVEHIVPTVVRHDVMTEEEISEIESGGGGRVVTDASKDNYSISYSQLIPVLINSIKELKAEVDALKKEVAEK